LVNNYKRVFSIIWQMQICLCRDAMHGVSTGCVLLFICEKCRWILFEPDLLGFQNLVGLAVGTVDC